MYRKINGVNEKKICQEKWVNSTYHTFFKELCVVKSD